MADERSTLVGTEVAIVARGREDGSEEGISNNSELETENRKSDVKTDGVSVGRGRSKLEVEKKNDDVKGAIKLSELMSTKKNDDEMDGTSLVLVSEGEGVGRGDDMSKVADGTKEAT